MTKPVLRYFKFPGRCYAARIAMFNSFGKDGWTDERLFQSAFKKLKQEAAEARKKAGPGGGGDGLLATDNLPQLLVAGMTVTQSHAIARWAARQPGGKFELYPRGGAAADLDRALLVDEAMALVDGLVGLAPKDQDKELRLQRRAAYAGENGPLRVGMGLLEGRLQVAAAATESGPFLLGKQLTIADLYVKKPLVDMIKDGQFEAVEKDYVEKHFPLLFRHSASVADHDLVQEYLAAGYEN